MKTHRRFEFRRTFMVTDADSREEFSFAHVVAVAWLDDGTVSSAIQVHTGGDSLSPARAVKLAATITTAVAAVAELIEEAKRCARESES